MSQRQILIVEDEWIVAESVKFSLQKLEYGVSDIVCSGDEAIRRVEADRPDLVLMDIKLPGKMDGIQTANHIFFHYKVPVIFLTAYADVKILQQAISAKPFGYLIKPFRDKELLSAIEIGFYRCKMEARIEVLNDMLQIIHNVNQTIARETDRNKMLQTICLQISEIGGGSAALIVMTNKSGQFEEVFHAGLGDDFLTTLAEIKQGSLTEYLRQSLAQNGPVIIEDITAVCAVLASSKKQKLLKAITMPLKSKEKTYGVLVICPLKYFLGDSEMLALCGELAKDIGFALHAQELTEERKRAEEQMRNLAIHLLSVREEERMEVAREIHDEFGQVLTALKIELTLLAKKINFPSKLLQDRMQNAINLVETTITKVKKLIGELRPLILEDFGIAEAIRAHIQDFERLTEVPCEFSVGPPNIEAPKDVTIALFRIFQEALTNVARHAHATRVFIKLLADDKKIYMEIRDNGKGIQEEQLQDPHAFGLIGMQERARILNGTVRFTNSPGQGTTVVVTLPTR